MLKRLAPFALIVLGTTVAIAANALPLSEWDVSIEFPSSAEIDLGTMPWVLRVGEPLDDGWGLYWRIGCRGGGRVEVERAPQEAPFAHFLARLGEACDPSSLFRVGAIGAAAALFYMASMALLVDRRSMLDVAGGVLAAGGICFLSIMALALLGPAIGYILDPVSPHCTGNLVLHASLLRVHWETVAVFAAGILLQVWAVVLMARGVAAALRRRRERQQAR